MSVVAISTGSAVLAWIGLGLGVVILLVVIGLFNRIMRPALEINRYADDILQAGVAIGRKLDGVDELERTRQLGSAVPDLAGAYLRRLGGAP